MRVDEVEKYLDLKGVPKDMYSLKGGLPSEAYCIERVQDKWHLYYSERGHKWTIGMFTREEDVVEAFVDKIIEYAKMLPGFSPNDF